MRLIADYHTHTIYSHGKGRIEDNIQAAINQGLEIVGIADHGPEHLLYGVNPFYYPMIREEIDELNQKYQYYGIKVLFGVEANIISFDGTIDVTEIDLEYLDYVLLGYHYFVNMETKKDTYHWYVKNNLHEKGIKQKNHESLLTDALILAMKKYPIKAITHPGAKVSIDLEKLADAAYEHDVLLEINEKNRELSTESLLKIKDKSVNFLMSSDAHRPLDVGKVDKCMARIEKAGIDVDKIENLRE